MSHSEDLSTSSSAGFRQKIYRGVVVFGVVACALVMMIPLYMLSNVISAQSQRLEQLEQRLQATEMKSTDSVSRAFVNEQLGALHKEQIALKQAHSSLTESMAKVSDRLEAAEKREMLQLTDELEERFKQLESRQEQLVRDVQNLRNQPRKPENAEKSGVALKSANQKPRMHRSGSSVPVSSSRKAPFQLTSVEYRGGASFCCVSAGRKQPVVPGTVINYRRRLSRLESGRDSAGQRSVPLSGAHPDF